MEAEKAAALTIDSDVQPLRLRSRADADHAHHDGHEHHARDSAAGPKLSRLAASPFLASALDRLAIAAVLAGLVWIGVVWAVR